MAQPFTLNHPLFDFMGNIGTIDGDSPAAMRYLEVKYSKFAADIYFDDMDCVDYVPNYDFTLQEPVVLPAKLPMILLNQIESIGYGYVSGIPQHNLSEVCDTVIAYLNNRNITIEQLISYLKAPDYPSFGIINGTATVHNAYLTGNGSISVRGNYKYDEKHHSIIITELPYGVKKNPDTDSKGFVNKVLELAAQDDPIINIKDIRDESNQDKIRIVLELKKEETVENAIPILYAKCKLEERTPIKMNMLDMNSELMIDVNLLTIVSEFIKFREIIYNKKFLKELEDLNNKHHILEGLMIIYKDINTVIDIIKKSSSTKEAINSLMIKFKISEIQANYVVELKLRNLTSLDIKSKEEELDAINIRIPQLTHYTRMVHDNPEITSMLIEEISNIKKKYGVPRKTIINNVFENVKCKSEKLTKAVPDTPASIIGLEKNGKIFIKRMESVDTNNNIGGKGVKQLPKELVEDYKLKFSIDCSTSDYLILISNKGKAYQLLAYNIDLMNSNARGKILSQYLNLDEDEVIEYCGLYHTFFSTVVLVTKNGLIKTIDMENNGIVNIRKNGKRIITLDANDSVASVHTTTKEEADIFIATKFGSGIRFNLENIRDSGNSSKGVRAINLRLNDYVISSTILNNNIKHVVFITTSGFMKKVDIKDLRITNRGGVGFLIVNRSTESEIAGCTTSNDDVTLITEKGRKNVIDIKNIKTTSRTAKGIIGIRLDEGDFVKDLI